MFRGRANKGWPLSGDRGLVKSGVVDGVGIEGVLGEETVPQDMGENCLQVVGVNGGLAVEEGIGTGGGLQSLAFDETSSVAGSEFSYTTVGERDDDTESLSSVTSAWFQQPAPSSSGGAA